MIKNEKRKTVYLIRHGESYSNTGTTRSDHTAKLTEKGRAQSARVAERCRVFDAEVILSSPAQRARETAEYIAKECRLPVEYMDLLQERWAPSEIRGMKKDDPFVLDIDRRIRQNFHVPGFRFSDEENFDDLKLRAEHIFKLLDDRTERTLILVTHGILLRLIVAYAVFGERLTGYECEMLSRTLRTEKTGIMTLTQNENLQEEGGASRWQLWRWNDHSHLEQTPVRSSQ